MADERSAADWRQMAIRERNIASYTFNAKHREAHLTRARACEKMAEVEERLALIVGHWIYGSKARVSAVRALLLEILNGEGKEP